MPVEFLLEPMGSSSDTTRLVMMYDGSGRRISKTLLTKSATATSWDTVKVTHYTGIGTEIREEFHNGSRERVSVVVNMPQGLGRYGIEDAADPFKGIPLDENGKPTFWSALNPKFEWFLKNHLGSTMLVYGTVSSTDPNTADIGETKAAYDYRAFGEMVTLSQPSDKVTENFTGKEHDDEISLDYFGARYLDPMLGMWISVDPARQFSSPYLYAGNGYNPVNGADGDGSIIKMHSRNSQTYNETVDAALKEIENSGSAGKAFIAKLRNSDQVITIKESSKGNHTAPASLGSHIKNFFGFGGDAEVLWQPEVVKGGRNSEGYSERPASIGLAHELGHAEDIIDGNFTMDKSINDKGIPIREENSIKRENEIRNDLGEPLREKY